MNVQFRKLTAKGFMSLVDETIEFNDLGVVLVKGENQYDQLFKSNGSGKSAIFDSILWVLTGSTSRGSSNVINRNLSPSVTSVELELGIDSDDYIITRTDGSSKSLTIIKNGEDISGSTFTKSKEILKSQLSFITYDVLTSIIILSQGLPSRLSSLRPSDRKSRLENLSNTDGILEEIQNKMSVAYTELLSKSTSCNTEKSKTNSSISSNQSTIDSCNRKIDEIVQYHKDNSGVTDSDIDVYRSKIKEIQDVIKSSREKYQTLIRMESEHSSKKSSLENSLREEEISINDIMNQYKSVSNNICPTCKTVLISSDDLKKDISEKLMSHKKRYSELSSGLSTINSVTIPSSYEYNEKIVTYNNKLIELTRLVDEYDKMSSSVDSFKSTRDECQIKVDELMKVLIDLEKLSKDLDKQLEIYNYYKSAISRKFRNFLLEGVIDYMNKRLKYYSQYLFSNNQYVYLENSGNNVNIRLEDSYFEDLSGGEGRRVDIILQLAQRDLSRTESGFSCNLLVLDEILDYLDSDGIYSVLNMLEKESSSVDTLMIVTHRSELNVPCDSELLVVKDKNQLSRIRR